MSGICACLRMCWGTESPHEASSQKEASTLPPQGSTPEINPLSASSRRVSSFVLNSSSSFELSPHSCSLATYNFRYSPKAGADTNALDEQIQLFDSTLPENLPPFERRPTPFPVITIEGPVNSPAEVSTNAENSVISQLAIQGSRSREIPSEHQNAVSSRDNTVLNFLQTDPAFHPPTS